MCVDCLLIFTKSNTYRNREKGDYLGQRIDYQAVSFVSQSNHGTPDFYDITKIKARFESSNSICENDNTRTQLRVIPNLQETWIILMPFPVDSNFRCLFHKTVALFYGTSFISEREVKVILYALSPRNLRCTSLTRKFNAMRDLITIN